MAHYLITGGCGFIGSHLADRLLSAGHGVRVLDDLSTGKRDQLSPQAELRVGDVADRTAVAQALAGMDGCFHLAAAASVERGNRDWLGTHRTNLTGTITVLDCARATAARAAIPVIYASSAAIYGEQPHAPQDEWMAPQPLSAYGADKLGCELHARVAAHVHGVPAVGMRLFNVYGPRQDSQSPYSAVVPLFCERLRQGLPITVHGDGQQVRDFVYVGDAAQALELAMQAQAKFPAGTVFNVCTGRATSILALAETIATLWGHRPSIVHAPPRPGDIRVSIGRAQRAVDELGFHATTTLPVGLRQMLLGYLPERARARGPHDAV